jgi:hypothetical protein
MPDYIPVPYSDAKPWVYWGWREQVSADLHRSFYRLNLLTLAHPDLTTQAAASVEELRERLEAQA